MPQDDVEEVSGYVAAMKHGLNRLKDLSLSLRLLEDIHGILVTRRRGSEKEPGEFRRSHNWVGGTRPGNAPFVPPPPDHLVDFLGLLEKFLHNDPVKTPLSIKAALAHVQFQSIHPFIDGNGRLGRLLITFLFSAEGALREPLLYLSLYFQQHRQQYYDLLQSVRLTVELKHHSDRGFRVFRVFRDCLCGVLTASYMTGTEDFSNQRNQSMF